MLRVLLWLCCLLPLSAWSQPAHFVQAERLLPPAIATPITPPPQTVAGLPDQGWQAVQLPDVALTRTPGQAQPAATQTVWYRFAVGAAQHTQAAPLYFYLPRWQTVGQVALYGDGRLLWQSEGDLVWNGFNQPVWVSLDPPGQLRPRELLLRMDSVPGLGGGISSAWIGSASEIAWRYQLRRFVQSQLLWAASVAFAVLGVFSIGVWWRRRHETMYLLCFIAALCFAARYAHFITALNTSLISSAWFGWVTVNSVSWMVAVILLFNFRLCGNRYPWMEGGMFASVVLHGIVTLPWLASSEDIAALSVYAYLIILLFTIPASFLAVRASWRIRSGPGLVVASITVLGYPLAVHDVMLQNYQLSLEHVYLLPLAQVSFCVMFAIIIYRRYISGIESLERSQEILVMKLREREEELNASHARLREIEQREILIRERQRLMHDMHDGLGGSLTSVLRMMEQGQVQGAGEGDRNERVRLALRECMDELRLTIDSLEPVESDISVLLASLRFRLQPRLEAAGMQLHWRVEALPPLPWLTPGHAMHVMRIVQEVVTNIIKHAEARNILFTTESDGEHACIYIDDNGRGFDGQSRSQEGGRGLGNIAQRAEILGGSASWTQRSPEPGTRFCLRLPLSRVA